MKPPIEGMKTIPQYADDPIMMSAWASLLGHLLLNSAELDQFMMETGHDLRNLIGRSPLDALIDQATGAEKEMVIAWADWVTKNHWGAE